jgi:sulfite reductase (NADPH) flavoprotein alpha-component
MHRARDTLGQLLVLAALTAIAVALLRLHDGAGWWPTTQPRAWWLAATSVLVYLLACAWWLRGKRPAVAIDGAGAPLLIVWASQTGFASELAERSAAALRDAGQAAQALPLERLDAATLAAASRMLFIASTSGEGDPPDHAAPFVQRTMREALALSGLRYGLLALGDRGYGNFCAFGRTLDAWLRRCGAHPLFDRVEVDNADPGTLRHWQHLLSHLGPTTLPISDWSRPDYGRWTLQARQWLNPGSAGAAVYRLVLLPADSVLPPWQAGDIAEVGPRHAPAIIDAYLERHRLDGNRLFDGQPLRDWLARSQLPGTPEADPIDLVARLVPLPHREYSIASVPGEGRLELLLRLQHGADGQPGLGSGWLCLHAAPGDAIALRIRSNPGFHAPSPRQPLVLIGNGTGVAGLRALLAERIAAGATCNWLLIGERNGAHDLHYRDDLARWQREHGLTRLDAVFSRDTATPHRYVQDALHAAADTLRSWVDDGASIMVCGSLRGMAPAVDQALLDILGAPAKEALLLQGRYRRDVY